MFKNRPRNPGNEALEFAAESLIESSGIRAGATLEEITQATAKVHRKPIVLLPVGDDELRSLTGLWAETEEQSYVFFRERDSPIYRLHSIFHELGHILADHRGCGALALIDRSRLSTKGAGQQIIRARGRGELDSPSERFAEEIAYSLSWTVFAGTSLGLPVAFT